MLWGLTLIALVGWWVCFAPTQLAGKSSYVLVHGSSMEPTLHGGDLVVVRQQPTYADGDLVVFRTVDRGVVIHRLQVRTEDGWLTRGDNRPAEDPWTVPDGAVVGAYWFDVPRVGQALAWVHDHPLPFAFGCALLTLLVYLPWRRRRMAPPLTAALATGESEPRRDGRTNAEYGVLVVSSLATLAALGLIGLLGMSHQLGTVRGVVAFLALAWAGGFTVYFLYHLYDGKGVAEPAKSMYALSGRLYLVSEFPALDEEVQEVSSAVELRTIAEKYRLPILHRIDPDTSTHEFLLITVQKGAFVWRPVIDPAKVSSDKDFFGGARRIIPRGAHQAPDVATGPGSAFQSHPVATAIVGGAATAMAASTVLGSSTSRPMALASLTGITLGLSPVGAHQPRGRRLRRTTWIVLWVGSAALVSLALSAQGWIAAHAHVAMLGVGGVAAVVVGLLVWRFADDGRKPSEPIPASDLDQVLPGM